MRPPVVVDTELEEILARAGEGRRLSREEGLRLLEASPEETLAAAYVAGVLGRKRAEGVATYVVNRNINFTNVCINSCGFCAFRRGPGSPSGYVLSPRDIAEKAEEAEAEGATEVCMQGGLHPRLDIEYYLSILEAVRSSTRLHIHAFSPMEILHIARQSGLSVRDALKVLKEHGLGSIPGTAAEILDDEVRQVICPTKLSTKEWVDVIKTAHRLGIPTTATMLYGHVEESAHQLAHLDVLREIQDQTKGFTEFVPLSFVHHNTPLYRSGVGRGGATGLEDLRVFAASRLYLDNFRNLQASWIKLGPKLSQLMLCFGANDLGGTLMEEKISRSAGAREGMLGRNDLERMIREAGLTPRQRDTLYNLIS
jgi:FO synthase subunit 2